jgi:hypothetical protein
MISKKPVPFGDRYSEKGLEISATIQTMGFNRRKMEDERRRLAEKQAAERRATDPQIIEDAARLVAAWNERQEKRMPMLFSPTIDAAIAARYWFLWGALPGLPNYQCDRSAHARPSSRRGDHEPYTGAVLSLLPAECTVCPARASLAKEHRR